MTTRKSKLLKSEGGIYYPEEVGALEALQARRHPTRVQALLRAVRDTALALHPGRNSFLEPVKRQDGVLGIYKIPVDDDGTPVEEKRECLTCDTNLIVDVGRAAIRALQAHTAEGGTAAGLLDLGYLAVGGGPLPTDGSSNGTLTPQPADTSILDELTTPSGGGGPVFRPLLSLTTPPPAPLKTNLWTAQIGTTELNGNFINNAGLFCLNESTLFAFRTFVNQLKDSSFVMEFRWTILF